MHRPLATLIATFATVAIAGSGGCTASGAAATRTPARLASADLAPSEAELREIPVSLLLSWGRAGTAVRLGDDLFITCRHVLPTRWNRVERAGAVHGFSLLARGEGDGTRDDWALLRLDPNPAAEPAAAPPLAIDPAFRVDAGDTVHLVGYWRGPEGRALTRDQARRLRPTVVAGRAVAVRDSPAFPRRDILFVDTPAGSIFPGMSGGAAVAWDSANRRLVLLGIYLGAAEYEPGQPQHQGSVQIVRRLPPEAIAAATEATKPRTAAKSPER